MASNATRVVVPHAAKTALPPLKPAQLLRKLEWNEQVSRRTLKAQRNERRNMNGGATRTTRKDVQPINPYVPGESCQAAFP